MLLVGLLARELRGLLLVPRMWVVGGSLLSQAFDPGDSYNGASFNVLFLPQTFMLMLCETIAAPRNTSTSHHTPPRSASTCEDAGKGAPRSNTDAAQDNTCVERACAHPA